MRSPSSISSVAIAMMAFTMRGILILHHQQSFASADEDYVTCGSIIKLTHMENNAGLHILQSGPHKISSGSNQQLVTGVPSARDSDSVTASFWIVKGGHNSKIDCKTGDKIPFGSKVRFTHLDTNANLHSHQYRSPLSQQQEVTGFGDSGQGDSGDDWTINARRSSSSNYWKRDELVYIRHVDTGKYLGSSQRAKFQRSNCGSRCPVMDHLEIFAKSGTDYMTQWKAELGMFLTV